MGGLVVDQIRRVMRALIDRDGDLAQEVIDRDRQVNAYDVEIDEKCVELLALHQPTAGDLRFLTTTLKIVTDIEREAMVGTPSFSSFSASPEQFRETFGCRAVSGDLPTSRSR